MLSVPELGYYEARNHIQSGDILLASGNVLFSKLIKFSTNSMWSHVAFIKKFYLDEVRPETGERKYRFFVLESVESRGVRAIPLSSYAYDYEGSKKGYNGKLMIARHDDFDISKLGMLAKKSVDLIGYRYDNIQIAKIAYRLSIKKLTGKLPRRNSSDNGLYICNEYLSECMKSVGLKADYHTPAEVYEDPKVKPLCWIKSVRE